MSKRKKPELTHAEVSRKGGKARMAGLTRKERAELGRRGAEKRWGKKPGNEKWRKLT